MRRLTDWPSKETAEILRPPENGGFRMTSGAQDPAVRNSWALTAGSCCNVKAIDKV
jgi:hypothetical protein